MDLAQTVREADPDRYFASLFAPADRRDALLALYAFDAEIASLRHKVREGLAGEIRLRWWSDALALPATERSGNPLADALRETIDRYQLPREAFDRYLDARIADLYDDPLPTRTDLEAYAGQTAGLVMQLACLVLNRTHAHEAADACGHGGCLFVLDRMLRDPVQARAFAPDELLAAMGVERSALETSLPDGVVSAIRALAEEHRAAFLQAVRKAPVTLRPAFLHLAPRLAPGGRPGPLRRKWAILKAATRGWPELTRT
jgi:15-cis-phytoene synthase